MEGVRLLSEDDVRLLSVLEQKKLAELDLKEILSALALDLFGDVEMRYLLSTTLHILMNL